MRKQYDDMTPRLERLVRRLSRFDARLQFVPGTSHVFPDMLSRQPLPNTETEHSTVAEMVQLDCLMIAALDSGGHFMRKLFEAGNAESWYKEICHFIHNEWPNHVQNCPVNI